MSEKTSNNGSVSIDLARRCMLMERVGLAFDVIPMCSPVDRIKAVARGVTLACKENENLRNIIQAEGYFNDLKAAAHFRMTGGQEFPAALKSTFERQAPVMREGAGV
jgi:hypothetical protein